MSASGPTNTPELAANTLDVLAPVPPAVAARPIMLTAPRLSAFLTRILLYHTQYRRDLGTIAALTAQITALKTREAQKKAGEARMKGEIVRLEGENSALRGERRRVFGEKSKAIDMLGVYDAEGPSAAKKHRV